MADEALKQQLKEMIVEVCDKDIPPADISDDEALFGPDTRLELDSIDGLQLSMALERQFGLRMTDSKELRRAFASVETLAGFLSRP